ncbi:MAG: hypothetical protein ABIS50_21660 [Luteolibacter sp.]|uniref:hypothetical protein n=1 Tax=Luteolibacter sp. TaxID=1962973 RepID=UPI0032640901
MKTTSESSRVLSVSSGWACRSLILAAALLPQVWAQPKEKAPKGFICIANTIAPGTGTVKVLVDGEDVYEPGYAFAAVTGGIGVPAGSHTVVFKREGVTEGTTKVNVEKDQTVTLIPFGEKVPATDQDKAHFIIRILRLKQKEIPEGRSASFISVSGLPEIAAELRDLQGNWEKVAVKRMVISEAKIHYPEGYNPIRVNGKDMEPIPIIDAGNYVVVLYDDADGNLKCLNFRDFKYLSAD